MIDTDKYEGHTKGIWIVQSGSVYLADEVTPIARMDRDTNHTTPVERDRNARLIADAPLLLAEVKRLREELDKQMEYIEWLEEFAPKAGEYNLPWDAYELAKGIHWTQMEEEE